MIKKRVLVLFSLLLSIIGIYFVMHFYQIFFGQIQNLVIIIHMYTLTEMIM